LTRWLPYVLATGASVPWLYLHLVGPAPGHALTAVLTGASILGAAFLLSWACEVAEMDVPRALAVSVLALVAVLPEYAVDATFAWKAAEEPAYAGYAIANMTGGNRLLLGLGWPLLGMLTFLRFRRREIEVPRDMGVEVTILLLSTIYAMVPVWRGSLTLLDTAVYVSLYVAYLVAAARGEDHEAEVVGPARALGELPAFARRLSVVFILVIAAGAIAYAAEPFAESLVETGRSFHIDEFVLVQWVAPLASESPEVVVAVLMVLRANSSTALRTLVSSNVNQWTLLVGTLAMVYSFAHGSPAALPLDGRQRDEVLLTAAQSLFGVAVLADLRFVLWQGAVLAALFLVQVALKDVHFWVGLGYVALAVSVFVGDRRSREGLVTCVRTFATMLAGGGAAH
jgi:cation:H+ antiporter